MWKETVLVSLSYELFSFYQHMEHSKPMKKKYKIVSKNDHIKKKNTNIQDSLYLFATS